MRAALEGPAVATTVAPRAVASCTASPPVTPPAPCIGGERGNREGGGRLPRDDRRLARNERDRSDEPFRPRALVSQRQWVGEHLIASCKACHVFADSVDDSRRLDAERQRWPVTDVPVTDPDDLVPVADTCRSHRDHDLVRRRRRWRWEVEHAHGVAERVDAGGSHLSHVHHLRMLEPAIRDPPGAPYPPPRSSPQRACGACGCREGLDA